MTTYSEQARRLGDRLIVDHAQSQIRTFFDELKNGTRNYQTVASLNAQIAQEYRGRCILELLQNAHDALAKAKRDDPRRISFVLNNDSQPVLLVGNSGQPFRRDDFEGICQLAQSPKNPNESVGNKGLGFRSVLQVSGCPEIWSTPLSANDPCFTFRFDPAVIDRVAEVSRELKQCGLEARSPFEDCPLVDWSQEQLEEYQWRLTKGRSDAAEAARALSPYAIPLRAATTPSAVQSLLDEGHTTVVRLPLDREGAVQSVKEQLDELRDTRSVVFLDHLRELTIEVDGERCVLGRTVEADASLEGSRIRQRRLRVGNTAMATVDGRARRFHMWTRVVGGDDDQRVANAIRAAVEHLPNRWPEVQQATIGVAVEDAPTSPEGAFVIFLPTAKTTGTGAHVNAPFYGSLNREQIDFDEPYNELLLDNVLDLCLDAVRGLAAGQPEAWRAGAVLDILSSMAPVGGEKWSLMDELRERAAERGRPLDDQALILCDDGWRTSGEARAMPALDDNDPVGVDRWRTSAGFAVVSKELDGREAAVDRLIDCLGGDLAPTHAEWVGTIERMARSVRDLEPDIDWNMFLSSLLAILPDDLRSEPQHGNPDPLASARFLPTGDGRLIAAADPMQLFFRPIQGVDDIADLEDVPRALREHIAFLHMDVRTHEGQPRRNTQVQKFLDGRFALLPRREQILQNVVIPALPPPPIPHGSPDAIRCAEILDWTLRLLGDEPPDTLSPLLRRLPVCCHEGWFPTGHAIFGPGWPNGHGDDITCLAAELPDDAAQRLLGTVLLPPDDERWHVSMEGRSQLFARAGVVEGLRLRSVHDVHFGMSSYGKVNDLSEKRPADIPPSVWAEWCEIAKQRLQPHFRGGFRYRLSGIRVLPGIDHLAELKPTGHRALSRLILASLRDWNTSWESVTVKKDDDGQRWQEAVTSPLKHWLSTFAWLNDGTERRQPLSRRWLVPLGEQLERYSHLDPLSRTLANGLAADHGLTEQLVRLGLNVYPTENDKTGPELLDALAAAWANNRVPTGRFDVFLGQVRDAWQHLDPSSGLPKTFLTRTGRRTFSTCGRVELRHIYLPDDEDRTRTLQDHGKAILEMRSKVARARELADALTGATEVGKASALEERHIINGVPWTERPEGISPLGETEYHWLPVVLLSVAAHGGPNPLGATTTAWQNSAKKLRRAGVLKCEDILVELVDDDRIVGSSEPPALWLPGDVLAIRRDLMSHEELAAATQALLDRQDILTYLKLVLSSFPIRKPVTQERIEYALDRAEIDSQAFADICQRWAGDTSLLVDRIRPVLMLFEVADDGLDAAAADVDRLQEWLSVNLSHWPTSDLLSAARRSRDDHEMGTAAWKALGEVAQLPAWNEALEKLGDRYETVQNDSVPEQTEALLEEAKALLRGFARHVAIKEDKPNLFHRIESVMQDFAGETDWAARWWEVPFIAIIGALRDRYVEILGTKSHLPVLRNVGSVKELRDQFEREGIEIAPDPDETADGNVRRLEGVLTDVFDLYQTWMELDTTKETRPQAPDMPPIPPAAYLRRWSDAELLKMALDILDDKEFANACDGCSTPDAIRQQLDLKPEEVEARREERHLREQEARRKRRTFDVAGVPFEVNGAESYSALFDRLRKLADPEGPCARQDEFTPLEVVPTNGGRGGRGCGGTTVQPVRRPSADHRELVGIVGEIHAYRYLSREFEEAVTPAAWVSEIRRKVLPLVGETDNVSDSHGFDFRFTHKRKKMHVEVKATATEEDDSQFELGISEIDAATRLARRGRWRILRIRDALSAQPKFDWLPNPFEEKYRDHYSLHKGGMRVSYRVSPQ